jgi:hypothetical protein
MIYSHIYIRLSGKGKRFPILSSAEPVVQEGRIIQSSTHEISGFGKDARMVQRYLGRGVFAFLPALRLGFSKLHGLGLFVLQDIFPGTFLTEYGGEYICETDAKKRMFDKTDSHMRTIMASFLHLDGSLHGQFTEDWYCNHHKAGAFANASVKVHERNTEYAKLLIPDSHAYCQPYDFEQSTKSYGTAFEWRIFLKATKFIPAGGEIIVHYGSQYYARHNFD